MPKALEERYLGANGGNLGGDGASMFLGGARWVRYGQTKLANAVWTQALHERLQARGHSSIKAVCAAPGLAATNLQVTKQARLNYTQQESRTHRLCSRLYSKQCRGASDASVVEEVVGGGGSIPSPLRLSASASLPA